MSAPLTKLNLEAAIEQSEPMDGYRCDLPIPQGAWLNGADDTILTGITTPARALLTVTVAGTGLVQWAANAAATVIAAAQIVMPGEYNDVAKNPGDRLADDLVLRAVMRRQRNAADAAAWSARLTVRWFRPGTDTSAYRTLTTNPTAVVPTISADNTASLTGFSTLTFDIGARLRAEGVKILAGDVVRLLLGPDSQNANAALQLAGATLRYRRNAALRDRTVR